MSRYIIGLVCFVSGIGLGTKLVRPEVKTTPAPEIREVQVVNEFGAGIETIKVTGMAENEDRTYRVFAQRLP